MPNNQIGSALSDVERILSESLIREIENLSKQVNRIEGNMQRTEDKQEAAIRELTKKLEEVAKDLSVTMRKYDEKLARQQTETALNRLRISMWGGLGGSATVGALEIIKSLFGAGG